jgi:glutathione peroxidase-family protein
MSRSMESNVLKFCSEQYPDRCCEQDSNEINNFCKHDYLILLHMFQINYNNFGNIYLDVLYCVGSLI